MLRLTNRTASGSGAGKQQHSSNRSGGKLLSLRYTLGRYDFVMVFEILSREMRVKFLAIVEKSGIVRT